MSLARKANGGEISFSEIKQQNEQWMIQQEIEDLQGQIDNISVNLDHEFRLRPSIKGKANGQIDVLQDEINKYHNQIEMLKLKQQLQRQIVSVGRENGGQTRFGIEATSVQCQGLNCGLNKSNLQEIGCDIF